VGRLAAFWHCRAHCQPFSNKRLANIHAVRLDETVASHQLQTSHPGFAKTDIAGVRNECLQTRPCPAPEFAFAGASSRFARRIQLMQSDQVAIDPDMLSVDNFRRIATRGTDECKPKRYDY
jgi:hypothetical protein